jgi:hypothetical protein
MQNTPLCMQSTPNATGEAAHITELKILSIQHMACSRPNICAECSVANHSKAGSYMVVVYEHRYKSQSMMSGWSANRK